LGEFLERENAPCYFRDFAAIAEAHGLSYLCETELHQCIPEHISAEVGAMIRTMSCNNLIPLEQYVDFFRGRTFRQTLLVKAKRAKEIERQLVPDRVRGLHVSGRMTSTNMGDGSFKLLSPTGASLITRHSGVCQAMEKLSAVFPATRTVAELVAEGRGAPYRAVANLEPAMLDAAFQMIIIGLLNVSTVPLRPKAAGAKPRAWLLSRLDGLQGRSWTTSPAHSVVQLDAISTALLPFLDGTHNRDALRRKLLAIVQQGRIRLLDKATGTDLKANALKAAAEEHVTLALEKLAADGLLD
jgi:methyltransferase-like protein